MVKAIVEEINKSHREQIEPIKKELLLIDTELTKLTERKKNLFELYEDGLASKEDFMERKTTLNESIKIHINDGIIRFLSGEGDVPNKGTSSFWVPYTINIEFCI